MPLYAALRMTLSNDLFKVVDELETYCYEIDYLAYC